MKIAIGADHKGFKLKNKIKSVLESLGHSVLDMGPDSEDSVDYPEYGLKVARAVASKEADKGITICWTGNGMNIVANKVKGIRAGMALSTEMAHLTRLHNDANIITLSAKYTPDSEIEEIIKTFLETEFEGGRHIKRVDMITQAESEN